MSKVLNNLLAKRAWISYIDDERADGNSIIVTLARGWYFADETDSGVRGFDTVREVQIGTAKDNVIQK
jgi:hypothetical protein